jgi:hypothetical protein
MHMTKPFITFGMIVLNGEPFIRYNLRALYPFAHQIIIVEGACQAAAAIATQNGHSTDGTLETLRQFKQGNDPDNKLVIVTAEDEGYNDGFWQGEKLEMSQAYARRATGSYLWQIDVDEFYKKDDIALILKLLADDPTIASISFPILTFWGGIKYVLDGFSFRYTGDGNCHRVFKWEVGYQYNTHRPPTILDNNGKNLRKLNWLNASKMKKKGIYMYHYDMLLPIQAERKSLYYSKVNWHDYESYKLLNWKESIYDKLLDPYHPYTVYTHYSWLNRYEGMHPWVINEMIKDIVTGLYPGIRFRNISDIEQLINSGHYKFGRILRILYVVCIDGPMFKIKLTVHDLLIKTPLWLLIQKIRGRR